MSYSGNDLSREGNSWKSGVIGTGLFVVFCLFYAEILHAFLQSFRFWCYFQNTSLYLCILSFPLNNNLNICFIVKIQDCMSFRTYHIGVRRHAISEQLNRLP